LIPMRTEPGQVRTQTGPRAWSVGSSGISKYSTYHLTKVTRPDYVDRTGGWCGALVHTR
jgi:hypothetical protein